MTQKREAETTARTRRRSVYTGTGDEAGDGRMWVLFGKREEIQRLSGRN